ncbi:hypothetical protein S40285_09617 [Stachybotrys chlorohalonatus IBT 40285]|uniref:CENP-V/GFA domain-containing protein n=1 Tax=Stachybotrys chlorohalonatus (strain IBT 40285) TaxID=1283841 RepID=A0A084QC44_STAC4|nr:hypothetical protein S40285_09617 [Stachybotrys chlorohalonata IBT 40285]
MTTPASSIRCHCGAVTQEVKFRQSAALTLCHCQSCRHISGVLCTSYFPVDGFLVSNNVRSYSCSAQLTKYFCAVCGCHVAQARKGDQGTEDWGVATGTITRLGESESGTFASHRHVEDTRDGGIARFVEFSSQDPGQNTSSTSDNSLRRELEHSQPANEEEDTLDASCLCGRVNFFITRPDAKSHEPSRPMPDLTHPEKTTPPAVKSNPSDLKWWIRGNGCKYLAGTCACQSCRLISGFDIQTWAFVPRWNIVFRVSGPDNVVYPLDFDALPTNILQTYASSPGARRDFCGTCGATVFWREVSQPDVVDVSVGLLRAREGARAEAWLEWWTDRVSYSEEVGTGREGLVINMASDLIKSLEKGLQASK